MEREELHTKNVDDIPRTRIARAEAIGMLGLKASGRMVSSSAATLLRGGDGKGALSAGRRAATEEIFADLGRMRGVAAKLGQLLLYSPAGVEEGVEQIFELSNQLPPMTYGLVRAQIRRELGAEPEQVFSSFERNPIAAASLGQVHLARDHHGAQLAVKVQYPGVAESVRSDLENMRLLTWPLERMMKLANVEGALSEIEDRVLEELDYRIERRNLEDFRGAFADDRDIRIPRSYANSTRSILIMEAIDGIVVSALMAQEPSLEVRRRFGELSLRFGWTSVFGHGVLHADPNPGNYLFCPNGQLGVVDFGCVKRLTPALVGGVRDLVGAARRGHFQDMQRALESAGILPNVAPNTVRQAVATWMLAWTEPFRGREFDFSDRSYLQGLLNAQGHFRRAIQQSPGFPLPEQWLFFARHLVGGAYMLHRLRIRANYGSLLEQLTA